MNISFGLLVVVVVVIVVWLFKLKTENTGKEVIAIIQPFRGKIENIISTTGTVFPRNRIEVKPPVSGRIDEILVREGEKVTEGQALIWMSSTERATLLDSARNQNEETLAYWREVYKPISITSPIDGEIIVSKMQPGQTITTADAIIVLSDQLIVRAQVDETDIGKIMPGQKAVIELDAYPDTKINATVQHIYYESKIVNNVTIYEVDFTLEYVPQFFRSGMNASVNCIQDSKEGALLIPLEAVTKEQNEDFVLVAQSPTAEPVKRKVTLGLSDDKNVEVLSGLTESDTIIVKSKKYTLPKGSAGTNPFRDCCEMS